MLVRAWNALELELVRAWNALELELFFHVSFMKLRYDTWLVASEMKTYVHALLPLQYPQRAKGMVNDQMYSKH